MSYRITLHTVDDLIECLSKSELKGRILEQIITVTVNMGGAGADMREIYFNQLDHFSWNADNDELEIDI